MRTLRLILLLAAGLLAAIAGCSDDEFAPTLDSTRRPIDLDGAGKRKVIGPTDIVLCLDVSDSISGVELKAQIDGLAVCLDDESLFPPNGDVSMAVWVYGDTIAAAVERLTPVTEENVKDIFGPAFTGLLDDRLVSGSTADLASSLSNAGSVLGEGRALDAQVLISGSGEAADEQAARDACSQLVNAGVMISALGVNPTESGEKLLMDCSADLGGFYQTVVAGYADACEDAFEYMLVVELELLPEHEVLDRGEVHRLEAGVFRASDIKSYPEVGLDVQFRVISGPNSGLNSTSVTDTNGVALWAYRGEGGSGTDVIVATTTHPQTGTALADSSTATWINAAPDCDAGGRYEVDVTTDTVMVQLDGTDSSDADGDSLSYRWSLDCEDASFDDATLARPKLTLTGECVCAGALTVDLLVYDSEDSSSCQAGIVLNDLRPPVIEAGPPYELWPPNHKYRTITPEMLLARAEDGCGNPLDLSGVEIVEVHSDEPENDNGDGNTAADILVSCPNGLQLRAERRGGGDGRVYTVVYRITDDAGNSTRVEARVFVPHDKGRGSAGGGDDGEYTVTSNCGETE